MPEQQRSRGGNKNAGLPEATSGIPAEAVGQDEIGSGNGENDSRADTGNLGPSRRVKKFWQVRYIKETKKLSRDFRTFERASEFVLALCRYCKPYIFVVEGEFPGGDEKIPAPCPCCRKKVSGRWRAESVPAKPVDQYKYLLDRRRELTLQGKEGSEEFKGLEREMDDAWYEMTEGQRWWMEQKLNQEVENK